MTAENLFTLTKFYKGWDPEIQTGTAERFYPLTKIYVAGITINF